MLSLTGTLSRNSMVYVVDSGLDYHRKITEFATNVYKAIGSQSGASWMCGDTLITCTLHRTGAP